MKAPEKIYLVRTTRIIDEWRRNPSQYGYNIEYARTDAFIAKAYDWLQNHTMKELCMKEEDSGLVQEFIENFKDYMKGE